MINVEKLEFCYERGAPPALTDVQLSVERGSLFGLLGPNGAGKTTLLSILCGILPCPPGTVRIAGVDVGADRDAARSAIALVPQEYAFYPTLTVRENLTFFARMQRIPAAEIDARVAEVMTVTSLVDRADQRADRQSGGLKRRLNMAIGLLNRPQLLLLDEPTVGIDPHSRHFILEAIRDVNRAGTTVVYTSHYMEEVEFLCDDIAIIDQGRVQLRGVLSSLLGADERSRLVVGLHEPLTESQRLALHESIRFDEHELSLSIEVDTAAGFGRALQELTRQGVGISRIQYGNRNLEELFLNITQRTLRD